MHLLDSRCHLPLVGVEGSRLRVGDSMEHQEAGKMYVFDDSFEHEVALEC